MGAVALRPQRPSSFGNKSSNGHTAQQEVSMSNPSSVPTKATSFVSRIVRHDSTKKGVAAAAAGLLIAVVCEALWPSSS
jgi:hypothetical protein